MSGDIAKGILIIISEKYQNRTSERMPEDMSEKDVKKYVGKGCQKICQIRMSEDALERMSTETSNYMSDKNVKRYVRGSVNRNVRNMSDKIVRRYVR